MNDAEKKHEIIKLAEMFARQPLATPHGEHRYGRLGVSTTQGTIAVRLYPDSANGTSWGYDTVYATARDHEAERKSLNREMERMGIGMKGGRKIYSEIAWEPKLADEALELLQLATVLDQLADI